MIIGQRQLLYKIDKIIDRYPKFSIIIGPPGSGKRTICNYICKKLNLPLLYFSSKIDEVRNAIDTAYEQYEPICYVFPNADDMSVNAKNCLLKVTEEPPKNAYIMLTLQDIGNTLPTIQSRGTILTLDNYNYEDILNYRIFRKYKDEHDKLVSEICSTTGEVDELFTNDIPGFYQFSEHVANNIHIPTSGNIFKITKFMKLKDGDNGYSTSLVFKTIRNIYINNAIKTKKHQYLLASNVTSECLRDLQLNTVSKLSTIDKWIFDVRKALRGI